MAPWASVIVLLGWTYMCGMIVIIGAEVSSEYQRMRMGAKPRTACTEPSPEDVAFPMRCQLASASILRPRCAVVCHYAAFL